MKIGLIEAQASFPLFLSLSNDELLHVSQLSFSRRPLQVQVRTSASHRPSHLSTGPSYPSRPSPVVNLSRNNNDLSPTASFFLPSSSDASNRSHRSVKLF
jgi:hypothetical protein